MRFLKLFKRKRQPRKVENLSERSRRMRSQLKHNPTTGELLVTRRYKDAVIDEVIEYLKNL